MQLTMEKGEYAQIQQDRAHNGFSCCLAIGQRAVMAYRMALFLEQEARVSLGAQFDIRAHGAAIYQACQTLGVPIKTYHVVEEIDVLAHHLLPKLAAGSISLQEAQGHIRALKQRTIKHARAEKLVAMAALATEQAQRTHHIEQGQTWRLGRHFLYCGDSSSQEFQALCKQHTVSFVFADCPYNTGVDTWDTGFVWQHDYLAELAPVVGVTPGLKHLPAFLAGTHMPYKWSIAYQITNTETASPVGYSHWDQVLLFSAGSIQRNMPDHFKLTPPQQQRDGFVHKGKKTLVMLLHLLGLFSLEGQTVVDAFAGSGTTLIAAERSGRTCITAEISPEYTAMVIARFEGVTHKKAVLL